MVMPWLCKCQLLPEDCQCTASVLQLPRFCQGKRQSLLRVLQLQLLASFCHDIARATLYWLRLKGRLGPA